jgi:hypothetical protein
MSVTVARAFPSMLTDFSSLRPLAFAYRGSTWIRRWTA